MGGDGHGAEGRGREDGAGTGWEGGRGYGGHGD